MNKILICSGILYCTMLSGTFAQNPKVKLDSLSKIKTGEQTRLVIQLPWDGKTSVIWPELKDSIGKIEIVSVNKIDTLVNNHQKTLSQSITITAFDSGVYTIPALPFEFPQKTDSASRFRYSDSLQLTVFEPKADTTKAIKDIKDIESAPLTWEEIYPWILVALGLSALVVLGWWLYGKYKRKESLLSFAAKPKLPAHETALLQLEEIRKQRIWQSGKVKEYHTAITDTLRIYIEERFGINAKEMISDDIKLSLSTLIDEASSKALSKTLETADMVKFAKAEPLPDEHDSSLQNAVNFVQNTMIKNDHQPKNAE